MAFLVGKPILKLDRSAITAMDSGLTPATIRPRCMAITSFSGPRNCLSADKKGYEDTPISKADTVVLGVSSDCAACVGTAPIEASKKTTVTLISTSKIAKKNLIKIKPYTFLTFILCGLLRLGQACQIHIIGCLPFMAGVATFAVVPVDVAGNVCSGLADRLESLAVHAFVLY